MILARFRDLESLQAAAARMRAEPGTAVEVYLPFDPPEDGPPSESSWVPIAILVAGVAGAAGFFGLQAFAEGWSYPMNIGGRPDVSWPPYVPNAVEVGILLAVAVGLLGFLVACGLPRLFHPVDRFAMAPEASRDAFLLLAESDDPGRVRTVLEGLQPMRLEEMA